MKISDHLIGLGVAVPIALMLLISLKGVFTGGAEFSPGTFTYDPKDAGVSPFSQPANAENR